MKKYLHEFYDFRSTPTIILMMQAEQHPFLVMLASWKDIFPEYELNDTTGWIKVKLDNTEYYLSSIKKTRLEIINDLYAQYLKLNHNKITLGQDGKIKTT